MKSVFQMAFSRNAYYVIFNFIQTNKKGSEIEYFYLIAITYKLSLLYLTDWNPIQSILLLQHGEICIIVYGTVFIQELLQKYMKFRSKAVRCKRLRRHVRCLEKPGIILFTKAATCFARMPYALRF